MSGQIIGLHDWLATPPGQYLLGVEQQLLDQALSDLFGYHALQIGLPALDALRANRMPHRWLACSPADPPVHGRAPVLYTDYAALPLAPQSLDLVVLPHTLELSVDPHATLREVERVLVPEGRAVICGFNPASLWGMRQRRARLGARLGLGQPFLPEAGEFLGYWRLRDWLRLLGFGIEAGCFGCYRPALRSARWLARFAWMDPAGARWWPIFGALYFLVAVKRVPGMRPLGAAWRRPQAFVGAPVSIAGHAGSAGVATQNGIQERDGDGIGQG